MSFSSLENFIKQKKNVKKLFSEKLFFAFGLPLVAIILDRELSKNQENLIKKVFEGLVHLEIQTIVLSDKAIRDNFLEGSRIVVLPYSRRNRKYLLEACDIALCFDFNDVEEILLNGAIPISAPREELSNYHPNHETGNAFVYEKINAWSIFATVVRAVETFKFPYDWQGIVRQGLESVKCEV